MARTIAEIKKTLTDDFITDEVVIEMYGLTPGNTFEQEFSPVSIESNLFDRCAFGLWTVEKLFDIHVASVQQYIDNMKPHSRPWYESMALEFQLGQDLVQDEIFYDNTGLTDEEIAGMKIVKYASVTDRPGGLYMKVAGISGGDLAPLSPEDHAAFVEYIKRVKDAGVRFWHLNEPADSLKADIVIYYDPLILNNQGQLISDTGVKPVEVAVDTFLKRQTFNGKFIPALFTDYLQQTTGVSIPHVVSLQAQYGSLPYSEVPANGYTPYAGYLRILAPEDLTIQYIPFV